MNPQYKTVNEKDSTVTHKNIGQGGRNSNNPYVQTTTPTSASDKSKQKKCKM